MNGNIYKLERRTGTAQLAAPRYTIRTRQVAHWLFWSKWVFDVEDDFLLVRGLSTKQLDLFISLIGSRNVRFAKGNFAL